jgi:peptidyl-dipeptidase Dcp
MQMARLARRLPVLVLTLAMASPASANALLAPWKTPLETPPFDAIQVADYEPAVEKAIAEHDAELDAIRKSTAAPTFENTLVAMDASGKLLERVTGPFFALQGALITPDLQAAAREILPLLSKHQDDVTLDARLFARVKAVHDGRARLRLDDQQRYLLERTYQNFVLGGALLTGEARERFRKVNEDIKLLELKFSDNVLAETNDSYLVLGEADLVGLPDSTRAMGAEAARALKLEGKYVFTTQRTSWTPFLTYSSRRDLRERLYTAYFMRSDRDNEHDNKAVMQKVLVLRAERARLLGFPTPAHNALADRMAGTPDKVLEFLDSLWKPALARAKSEAADLQLMAAKDGVKELAPWDWWYYAEKVRLEKYGFDDSALRPYFELENVRTGAFGLVTKLYGVSFKQRKDIQVYHPDVRVYEVKDGDGTLLGLLYTDFFARDTKRGGAWSGAMRGPRWENGKRTVPFATLCTNFAKPSAESPSLLSADEVETLFHELGHAVNTIFSNGHYAAYNAPLDVVELPSQVMENWVFEPELLASYARHFKTGELIPKELVARVLNARKFNQGFATVEYLAASYLDQALHGLAEPANVNLTRFEQKTMDQLGLIPAILPRYRTTYFEHVVGGYTAGYYAYIWAEVLDADAFAAFKEKSLFDRKVAGSFRKNILESLGTEDSMTLYKRVRGREPSVKPLLEKRGLVGEAGVAK